jgi:hypothetical protein
MSIHINTLGLNLAITLSVNPYSHLEVAYEDWIRCDVKLVVPGFTGSLPVELELLDFSRFLDELRRMSLSVGTPMQAALSGLEPGMALELNSDHTGHIFGKYEFIHNWNAAEIKLIGSFEMDQSYIQPLILEIQNSIMKISEKE